jgi:hypothetical protein
MGNAFLRTTSEPVHSVGGAGHPWKRAQAVGYLHALQDSETCLTKSRLC